METQYSQLIDRLSNFGEARSRSHIDPETWHEYLQSGFDQSHVPDLIRILGDDAIHESVSDDIAMAPIHASRILAELKATEAIPTVISLLSRIDEAFDDWIGEELPDIFSKIGPVSFEPLKSYAHNTQNGEHSRICSFRVISKIGLDYPNERTRCVETLTDLLRAHAMNDNGVNAFLILSLSDLGALESLDVVREAYEERHVDLSVLGDLGEAELYFRDGAGDEEARDTLRKRRIERAREFSRMFHAYDPAETQPAQIIERRQPIDATPKIGRNDPCPCGSGKKYKKCCGC